MKPWALEFRRANGFNAECTKSKDGCAIFSANRPGTTKRLEQASPCPQPFKIGKLTSAKCYRFRIPIRMEPENVVDRGSIWFDIDIGRIFLMG